MQEDGRMFSRFLLVTAGSTAIHSAKNPMIVQKRLTEKIAYSVARKRETTPVQDRVIPLVVSALALVMPGRCLMNVGLVQAKEENLSKR